MRWRCLILLPVVLMAGCGDDDRLVVAPSATPPAPVQVEETADAIILRSTAATVRIDKATAGLSLEDAAGARLTESAAAPTFKLRSTAQALQSVRSVQRTERGVELTCDAGSDTVSWSIEFLTPRTIATRLHPANPSAATRVITTLRAAPDERFYGLTERIVDAPSASLHDRNISEIDPAEVGSLDRRGEVITMVVTPTMGLYTPFFHSSRGYGAYVEGTMTGRYDLAKTTADTVAMDFELNQRTATHGVVYFVGDHDAILGEYTALTGRPFAPPRWGFRHWRWRDEHHFGPPAPLDGVDMNAELVEDLTMYEALSIPAGNYEFDRPWTGGSTNRGQEGFASFSFDPARFPNSAAMVAALQRRGYHVFIFIAPWALGDNAVDAERFGYYAPRSRILIDYTNLDAASWWMARVQSLVDMGITGLKLDRSEFALSELDVVPNLATDIWADGRSGREVQNDYPIIYARVHHDAFAARLGGGFLNYLRAGYAGSQQYGIFWGGDTPGTASFLIGAPTDLGLRSAILSLAHVAFMGFPIWGTDTGGYYEFGDRDVFARWLEFSALCPIMEIGGTGPHAPWDMPTEPHYDPEMIDIYRRYVTLHHELGPLLYSLAIEAHRSGRPLARPLVFDYPDDPAVGDLWDEFLIGHDLLVAPLWRVGDRSRQVYLPRGTWIDFWDPAQRVQGPTTITADAPLDRLPLYVRAGGILPLDVSSAVTGNGSLASAGRLTIDGYPSGTSSLTLHEDEGDSTFTLSETPATQLQIRGRPRGYIIRLLADAVRGVTLDGTALTSVDSFAALELDHRAWFFDIGAGRVWIKFATTGSVANVAVAK